MKADRNNSIRRAVQRITAAMIAVICIAAVAAVPADAKTKKKAKKSTKAAQTVTVQYKKPDVSGYDPNQFPLANIGLGSAMGSAAPTTGSFGEAYAAGNWRDASYYLKQDLQSKSAELEDEFGYSGSVEELMTSDPNDPEGVPYYLLDGVKIYNSSNDNWDGVMAEMPQLGNGFYIAARNFRHVEFDPVTSEIAQVYNYYYYGLGWFNQPLIFCGSYAPGTPDYLDVLSTSISEVWNYSIVLRYPNAVIAQYISDQAAAGTMNTAIKYSQANRLGFWNCFRKVGFDMTAITPAVQEQAYADCSSFVSGIVKSAGYVYNIPALQKVHEYDTTMTMAEDYRKAGFQVLNYAAVGAEGLQRGDILVNPTFHTAVYVPEILYADKQPMG